MTLFHSDRSMVHGYLSRTFWVLWGVSGLVLLIIAGGMSYAERPAVENGISTGKTPPSEETSTTEPDQVELISTQHAFNPSSKEKDPFKPLITKPQPVVPTPSPSKLRDVAPAPRLPPAPPALKIFVSGICGDDAERLALVIFENKPMVLRKNSLVEGKFKVVDIEPDRIVIYSQRENIRRTFPIGGGKE